MSNRPSWLSAVQIPLRNGARVRLVVLGMRIVAGDGMDYRKAATAGVSFWVGYGFEGGYLFTDQMSPFFAEMLGNDMTSGGLTALLLSGFVELAGPRRKRLVTSLGVDAVPKIQSFLSDFALRARWDEAMAGQVSLTAEEALLSLMGTRATTRTPDAACA